MNKKPKRTIVNEDGELPASEHIEGRWRLISAVIGALGVIIAAIIANNAGIIDIDINNSNNNNLNVTSIAVAATPDAIGATQTAISLTQTAIAQPTTVVQSPTPFATSLPPRTMVPTQIPLTSLLYENNFDNGQVEGIEYEGGVWRIVTEDNGNPVLQGTGGPQQDWWGIAYIGSSDWTDYAVELRLRWVNFGFTNIWVRASGFVDGYAFTMNEDGMFLNQIRNDANGVWRDIDSFFANIWSPAIDFNDWHSVYIVVEGNAIRVAFDGEWLSDAFDVDNDRYTQGQVNLGMTHNVIMWFDEIRIWSLE